MSNGQVTSSMNQFADSWQSGGKCNSKSVAPKHPCEDNPSRHKEALKDCAVIKSEYFKDCRGAVDLNNLYNDCMYDVCAGNIVCLRKHCLLIFNCQLLFKNFG